MRSINYQSTKFIQTTFVLIASVFLAVEGVIESTAFVTVTLGALGNYAYHDVKQKEIK